MHVQLHTYITGVSQCAVSKQHVCKHMCMLFHIFEPCFFFVQPCEIACVPVHVHVLVCVRVRQREGDSAS